MHETLIKTELKTKGREIVARTRGSSHGPITRLVSPSDRQPWKLWRGRTTSAASFARRRRSDQAALVPFLAATRSELPPGDSSNALRLSCLDTRYRCALSRR